MIKYSSIQLLRSTGEKFKFQVFGFSLPTYKKVI